MQHELATLSREVESLRREVRGQRVKQRRSLMVAVVAILIAAVSPVAAFAANPFGDLNAGSVHNDNIDAIYNAGITTGCDPNVSYCPNGLVTREEMASFLARTAGLGANPPVANAKTAQTATNATNAQYAVNATNAQYAVSATDAQNAAALGGYAPSALNRLAFSTDALTSTLPNNGGITDIAQVSVIIPGPTPQAVAVRGAFNAYNQPTGGNFIVSFRQDSTGAVGGLIFPYQVNTGIGMSAQAEWVFVAAPGTHTFTLHAQVAGAAGDLSVDGVRLVATTHPFGATGNPGATEIEPVAPKPAR